MKFREIQKKLRKDGWYLVKVTGSHYQYKHPTKKGKVSIPFHGDKDFKLRTANSILEQAGLK